MHAFRSGSSADMKQDSIRSNQSFPVIYSVYKFQGKITRVKILVPSGSTGLDLQIQIWRRNPSETFTLVETITKVVNSAGSLILVSTADESLFNDLTPNNQINGPSLNCGALLVANVKLPPTG